MTQQQNALFETLAKHPKLEVRIFEICNIVKNDSGRFITVDETEEFLQQQVRNLGQEVMGNGQLINQQNYWTKFPMSYNAKPAPNGILGRIQHF